MIARKVPTGRAWHRRLLAVAVAQGLCQSALGAGLSVTTLSDTVDPDDGLCSLREAITAANTDASPGATSGECAAGSGADTINFDAGASAGTLTLANGEMTIGSPLTIQGAGADQLTLDAGGLSRHFTVYDGGYAPGTTVNIEGLTLVNGSAQTGGAIANREVLTLADVVLSNNHATGNGGGLANGDSATTTLVDSILSGNTSGGRGGGVHNADYASLTLTSSTLIGNSAVSGGGLHNESSGLLAEADTTATDSTLADNTASIQGGAISNDGDVSLSRSTLSGNSAGRGGGVFNVGGITLTNSTLSGNSATSGGGLFNDYYRYVRASFRNSTVAGNTAATGGGILNYYYAELSLINTIVADSEQGVDCFNYGSVDGTNSLIESGNCTVASLIDADPELGALADNGGPTLTHAVTPGSPVIDAGAQNFCDSPDELTDQTGKPRSIDGDADGTPTCDIGAVEYEVPIFADGFESPRPQPPWLPLGPGET